MEMFSPAWAALPGRSPLRPEHNRSCTLRQSVWEAACLPSPLCTFTLQGHAWCAGISWSHLASPWTDQHPRQKECLLGQRCNMLLRLEVLVAATRATLAEPQAWQTIAPSPLSLPSASVVPKTEESHESSQTPSDRLEKPINMHPPQHVASPLPRTPLTCLSHPWQAEREQRSRGRRSDCPETEGGSGWRQSPFASRHGCEECSCSPYCLGSFVLLHPPGPQPQGQIYWEQDRNGFVERSPHVREAPWPWPCCTCLSGTWPHAPAPEGR